jgi:hypothetical protein
MKNKNKKLRLAQIKKQQEAYQREIWEEIIGILKLGPFKPAELTPYKQQISLDDLYYNFAWEAGENFKEIEKFSLNVDGHNIVASFGHNSMIGTTLLIHETDIDVLYYSADLIDALHDLKYITQLI